jgi:hypothetical protein
MALNAFTRDLGTGQGRIQPSGFTPVAGSLFAFVLGHDKPGMQADVNIGDFFEVSQIESFGSAKFLRCVARLRAPLALPAGVAWKLSLRIDGVERASQIVQAGRTRDRMDLAANVSKLSGNRTLAFRLEVVAV